MNPIIELHRPVLTGLGKVISRRSTLPVLGQVRVTRDRNGRVSLHASDLDTHVVYRAPEPDPGPACDFLVPYAPLNQAMKGSTERLQLMLEGKTAVRLKTFLGTTPIEQVLTSLPVDEYPPLPKVDGPPLAVDAHFRDALRQALSCCAEGSYEPAVNHVCLDVSDPQSHYVVAADGGQLYCANSFQFDLAAPVLIPNQRFLHWAQFLAEGTGELSVRPKGQKDGPWLQLKSGPWTFIAKSWDGPFPEWRKHLPKAGAVRTKLEFDAGTVATLLAGLPKLPAAKEHLSPVTLEVTTDSVRVKARAKDVEEWSVLAVPGVQVSGPPISLSFNREPFLKALRFGLTTVDITDDRSPVACSHGGRMLLIALLRTPEAPAASGPASPNETPVSAPPSASSAETPTDQPPAPMPQNLTPPVRGTRPVVPVETQTAYAAVVTHIEGVKSKLRDVITDLNETLTLLKAAEKEKKLSDKEVESVRATLRSLQRIQV